MDLVSRASVEREAAGRPPIQYVVVLTKVDKASSTMVKRTKEAVFKVFLFFITICEECI